jgi:hypothetical protein
MRTCSRGPGSQDHVVEHYARKCSVYTCCNITCLLHHHDWQHFVFKELLAQLPHLHSMDSSIAVCACDKSCSRCLFGCEVLDLHHCSWYVIQLCSCNEPSADPVHQQARADSPAERRRLVCSRLPLWQYGCWESSPGPAAAGPQTAALQTPDSRTTTITT